MLSRLAAVQLKSLSKEHGYLLLEVALAASCLVCLCAAVIVSTQGLMNYYYKEQVRLSASTLAADIRQLQQETMFSVVKKSKTLNVVKSGYGIYANGLKSTVYKSVDFAELGCEQVYFSDYLSSISFYQNGSPKNNGTYLLRHKKLQGFYCKLSLQPVTGRVTVSEYGG